jgi:hypothetical protein
VKFAIPKTFAIGKTNPAGCGLNHRINAEFDFQSRDRDRMMRITKEKGAEFCSAGYIQCYVLSSSTAFVEAEIVVGWQPRFRQQAGAVSAVETATRPVPDTLLVEYAAPSRWINFKTTKVKQ